MGDFIRSHSSTTFTHDDDVLIGGVSYKRKYPEYRFFSNSYDCNVLTEIDGEKQIIEVYGEGYIITTEDEDDNFHRYFTQDTVAVLKDEDAKLYWKLQWLDSMRWHDDVHLGKVLLFSCIGACLLVIHFIAGLFIINTGAVPNAFSQKVGLSFIYSVLLVASEMFLFAYGFKFLRIVFGFLSVLAHILNGKEKLSYYKQLFEKLSKANCRDKAQASKFMHKLLFFC